MISGSTNSLQGKVILVTGAAKRIGRGIALRLAKEGAKIAIHYQGSEAEARATASECGRAPIFRADLERVTEIERPDWWPTEEEVHAALRPEAAVRRPV